MLKKVIGTFGSRIFCTLIAFGIVLINSHEFGAQGVGTIGLFILGLTIIQNLTSFVGGPSLVYMLPRHNAFQLIFLSYGFNVLISIIGTFLLFIFRLIPYEYVWHLLLVSIFFSFYYVHSLFILAIEKIKIYNVLAVLQIIFQLGLMLILLYFFNIKNVASYIYAYLLSYVLMAVISIPYVWKNIKITNLKNSFSLLKQMLTYGFAIQIANFAQLLNYRLSYYIIEFCSGRKALGVFDLGTKLSEAVWILPKSMATVQYARISNSKENKIYAKKLTFAFLKLVFVFSLIATFLLVLIPASWIAFIFSAEFFEVKQILYVLAFGIILFSCNTIISHYFSSFGLYKINTYASIIGLIITAGIGLALIPVFISMPYMDVLMSIAGITTLSYTVSFTYTFFKFIKDAKVKVRDLKITSNDLSILTNEIKKILRHKQ